MPTRLLESDASVVTTLAVAFFANAFNALSELELSTWFAIGTFGLAVIVSALKARVFYLDGKIKEYQLDELREEHDKSNEDTEE